MNVMLIIYTFWNRKIFLISHLQYFTWDLSKEIVVTLGCIPRVLQTDESPTDLMKLNTRSMKTSSGHTTRDKSILKIFILISFSSRYLWIFKKFFFLRFQEKNFSIFIFIVSFWYLIILQLFVRENKNIE